MSDNETNNNSLVPVQPASLTRVETQLCYTNKLLSFQNEKKFIDFFVENPELFIEIISRFYPLNSFQIEKYEDLWNLETLLENEYLSLSIQSLEKLLDRYCNNINSCGMDRLSSSKSIKWSIKLIEKLKDKWNWGESVQYFPFNIGLSANESLPWSIELVEKFKDEWDWEILSLNKFLPWNIDFIKKYEDNWNWNYLSWNTSLPLTIDLIEKFKENWNWEKLSENESLTWSLELIEKFEDKWNWEYLSQNVFIPWSIESLTKYKLNWIYLSKNEFLPWTNELIQLFEFNWNWKGSDYVYGNDNLYGDEFDDLLYFKEYNGCLSSNKSLPWSIELIDKYKDNWDWNFLSANESLPWSNDLIEKYEDKWNWNINKYIDDEPQFIGFSSCKFLSWSIDFIDKYKDRWNWDYLSANESLPWTLELIEKFKDKWLWGGTGLGEPVGLSANKSLPWSIELVDKYKDKWNFMYLPQIISLPCSEDVIIIFNNEPNYTDLIWNKAFKPYVNDSIIDKVMNKIGNK